MEKKFKFHDEIEKLHMISNDQDELNRVVDENQMTQTLKEKSEQLCLMLGPN
jgi:hypothetical protein